MTDYRDPGAVERVESHMGVTVEEMARDVADGDDGHGRYGQGHC